MYLLSLDLQPQTAGQTRGITGQLDASPIWDGRDDPRKLMLGRGVVQLLPCGLFAGCDVTVVCNLPASRVLLFQSSITLDWKHVGYKRLYCMYEFYLSDLFINLFIFLTDYQELCDERTFFYTSLPAVVVAGSWCCPTSPPAPYRRTPPHFFFFSWMKKQEKARTVVTTHGDAGTLVCSTYKRSFTCTS